MSLPRLINTAKSVTILHNMAIEQNRNGFISQMRRDSEAALRGAGICSPRRGDRPSEAFNKEDGPRCDVVWGGPATTSAGYQVHDGDEDQDPLVGTGRYMRMAEKEAKDVHGHLFLPEDLAENVWAERGRLLSPYVRLPRSCSKVLS